MYPIHSKPLWIFYILMLERNPIAQVHRSLNCFIIQVKFCKSF